jgi:hypothetical protein
MVSLYVASCGGSRSSPLAPSAVTPQPLAGVVPFMRGTVSDTAFRPLAGALVEVLDGPQAGLSTHADLKGDFSFAGTFDETTRFRATKEGYATATRALQPFCAPCNPNYWINFSLEVLAPPVNMAGDYAVTFVADSSCTMLPNQVRTRTYAGTIPSASGPANAYIGVPLRGATFYTYLNDLSMGVAGNYVGFWLEVIVEQLAPDTFLTFGGLAAASITTSAVPAIVFPFDGTIDYCVTKSTTGQYDDCYHNQTSTHLLCTSGQHQLILTRR